jgi:hypothetical protein
MTNLIAQLSISLALTTNWTGYTFNGKELGYLATNHIATIGYECQSHTYTLKTTPSEIAVWRKAEPLINWTNIYIPRGGWIMTNNIIVQP